MYRIQESTIKRLHKESDAQQAVYITLTFELTFTRRVTHLYS